MDLNSSQDHPVREHQSGEPEAHRGEVTWLVRASAAAVAQVGLALLRKSCRLERRGDGWREVKTWACSSGKKSDLQGRNE